MVGLCMFLFIIDDQLKELNILELYNLSYDQIGRRKWEKLFIK